MQTPFLIGIALSLAVAVFARRAGLDRDRAFYATVVIVVASYYLLFAAMGGADPSVLFAESVVMINFAVLAVMGFNAGPWILVAALAGHGLFDALHGLAIANPGVPVWWPAFCGAYDVGAAVCLAAITLVANPLHLRSRPATN